MTAASSAAAAEEEEDREDAEGDGSRGLSNNLYSTLCLREKIEGVMVVMAGLAW